MNKFPIAIILCLLSVFAYLAVTKPAKTISYLLPNEKIPQTNDQKIKNNALEEIQKITEESYKIKSIYLESMPIRFQQGKLSLKVRGKLAFEKNKNFRIIITHALTGKEMDIGSNEKFYWFWSKRMNPSALNYGDWNYPSAENQSSLRTALNPNWLLEVLNFNFVPVEKAEIIKYKEGYAVIENRNGQNNEEVQTIILVDSKAKCVLGKYIYSNEKMLASCEYYDFKEGIPEKISIFWHEEDIKMTWDLSKIKINQQIDSQLWKMPNSDPKIKSLLKIN